MIVAEITEMLRNPIAIDFPIGRVNRQELAADVFLRRTALGRVDVRSIGADYGVEGRCARLQRQDIRARTAENEEDLGFLAKMMAKFFFRALGVNILSV